MNSADIVLPDVVVTVNMILLPLTVAATDIPLNGPSVSMTAYSTWSTAEAPLFALGLTRTFEVRMAVPWLILRVYSIACGLLDTAIVSIVVVVFAFTVTVVPVVDDEFPITVEGIVPERFPAVRFVRFAPETAPNEPDQVPEVIVPTEVRLDPVTPEPRVVELSTDVPLM